MRRIVLALVSLVVLPLADAESPLVREEHLRAKVAALAPDDFTPAAEETRLALAKLLVFEVERDFADAIALLEPLLGRTQAATGQLPIESIQSALGFAYSYSGRPAEAEPLINAAYEHSAQRLGAEDNETLALRGNRATFYGRLGRAAEAESELREIARLQHARDPNADDALHARTQWAITLGRLGRWPEAETVLRDVIARRVQLLGPDHPNLTHQLNLLCWVLYSTERASETTPLMEQIVAIREKELGRTATPTLTARYNLASVYMRTGRYDEADRLLIADLALVQSRPDEGWHETAGYLYRLAEIDLLRRRPEAAVARLRETEQLYLQPRTGGWRDTEHRDLENTRWLLARALLVTGERDAAHPITAAWLTHMEEQFNLQLTYTSEADRLAFLAHERPFDLPGTLGDAELLARASLRLKGLVLDSLLEDQALARASSDPTAARLLANYRAALTTAASAQSATALELSQLEQLERELARRALAPAAHRAALVANPTEVIARLAPNQAVVDFIRYRHDLPGQLAEERYLALLGTSRGWQTVPLGPAAPIDAAIGRYAILVTRGGPLSWAQDLRRLAFDPVRAALEATITRIYLSPDGALHGVAFATLPEDEAGQWVADRFEIAMIASARDLLPRPATALPHAGNPLVLAAPTWQGALAGLAALPGAQDEGLVVAARLKDSRLLTGDAATPAALAAAASPRLLHIATHALTPAEPDLPVNDRLRRSGLALAGESGLLDALQIAALDLHATELAFLSGCATGSGQVAQGEGVLGLRRGFARAGARALVLTLWPVADQDSRDLTAHFYDAFTASADPSAALRTAQLQFIRTLAKSGTAPAEILRRAGAHTISLRP